MMRIIGRSAVAMASSTQHRGRFEPLGTYLRACRKRLPAPATAIGPYFRLHERIGRAVTQEEVAEAIGVSRVWYATLESGSVRASSHVLNRIAAVFSLSPPDRLTLLQLSFPELESSSASAAIDENGNS